MKGRDNFPILKDPDGNVIGAIENVRDVTKRNRAEEAMIENEERFRNLFNNMSSGVAIYDFSDEVKGFVFIDINKAGVRITNTPREQIIGRKLHEVFPGIKEMGLLEVLKRVYKTGASEHYPTHMYNDEEMVFWVENFVYKLPGGEIVAIFDDVTAMKQAEDELKDRTEKLERLNKAFVGRELKMVELKKEIEELKNRHKA